MLRKNSNHSLKTTGVATLGLLSLVGGLALASPAIAATQSEEEAPASQTVTLDEDIEAEESQSSLEEDAALVEDMDAEEEEQPATQAESEVASRSVARGTLAVVEPSATVGSCRIPQGTYSAKKASSNTRLQGQTRYATAAAVAGHVKSKAVSKGGESALFVASGENFADGLALSALAAYAGWPILLTPQASLSAEISNYIATNKPTHVYIAGGNGAVSSAVERQIISKADAASGKKTQFMRLAGRNRYETSMKIAKCFDAGSEAFVTTGANFADAVVAGAPAADKGGPIILTPSGAINAEAQAALKAVAPSRINIIGGKWSDAQQNVASAAAGNKPVKVVSGANRYATSAKVATTFFPGTTAAVFSTGSNFPDALAGVAAADHNNAPIVLTKAACRPKDIESVAKGAKTHIRLGGTVVVSDAATTKTCVPAPVISTNAKVAAAAKSQVGKAYIYGGTGPNGFDCSGLTQYAHRQVGISIPRTTWAQWSAGQTVTSPRPGDVVVLNGGGHVGIYMGGGMMVDAGNPRVGVSYRAVYATPNAYVRFA